MEDALTLAAIRLVKAKRPAYVVSGPITGFLQVCLALDWKMHSATEIEDHNEIRYDLNKRSPAFMSGLAKEATRFALDRGFRQRRALQGKRADAGGLRTLCIEKESLTVPDARCADATMALMRTDCSTVLVSSVTVTVSQTSEEERIDTIGNALADEYAKKGALEHVRGGAFRIAQYHELLRLHTLALAWAVEFQFGMWRDGVQDHPPLKAEAGRCRKGDLHDGSRAPSPLRRRARKRVLVSKWDPPTWLIALSTRALHGNQEPLVPDQEARLDVEQGCALSLAHDVCAFDVFLHGVLHGSILACVRCGAYATSAPRLLGKVCEGDPVVSGRKGLEQQLRRLRSGRHPRGGLLTVSPRAG
eukprot:1656628-Amphidinium_carterae.1